MRHGFWIGFGIGYGSAKASCDGCSFVPTSGLFLKGGVGGSAFLWGHVGEVHSGSSVLFTGWKQTIFEFGLDLTIH